MVATGSPTSVFDLLLNGSLLYAGGAGFGNGFYFVIVDLVANDFLPVGAGGPNSMLLFINSVFLSVNRLFLNRLCLRIDIFWRTCYHVRIFKQNCCSKI